MRDRRMDNSGGIWGGIAALVAVTAVAVASGSCGRAAQGSAAPAELSAAVTLRRGPVLPPPGGAPVRPALVAPAPKPAVPEVGPFRLDHRAPLAPRWRPTLRRGPVAGWRPVSFRGAAGDRVTALYRAPADRRPGERLPAILLGHGHGSTKAEIVTYLEDALQGRRVHLLAVDHPYHGARRHGHDDVCKGQPEAVRRKWSLAVRDLRRAVSLLATLPGVDPGRIGYLGYSLGAMLGVLMVAHEPRVRATSLISPAGNWFALAASNSRWQFGWQRKTLRFRLNVPHFRRALRAVDPVRHIAKIAPRPLLLIAGRLDRVIRWHMTLALHNAAGTGKKFLLHRGGHDTPRFARRRAVDFLLERL